LQKIQDWGVTSMAIILFLAILPQAGFGQISPLNRPNLDNSQLNLFLKVSDVPLKNITLLQRNII
jgi:hypothetical protein